MNLFAQHAIAGQDVTIELFADEAKNIRNVETGHFWHYIGIVAVPTEKKEALLRRLLDARGGCDSEIKSNDLDHLPKRRTAEQWCRILLDDHAVGSIYLNVVGINRTLLNSRAFGGEQFEPVYNRFFRSAVLYGCKRFFSGRRVVISRLWHDEGDMEHHEYFPWHVLWRLDQDPSIECQTQRVDFCSSDHRKPRGCPESHLLQFVDLVLGLMVQLLDDTSRNRNRCATARLLAPLLARMMNEPNNPNSRYGHKDKYLISFFPRSALADAELFDQLARARSGFYLQRPLIQIERESGQLHLFG